MIKNRLAEGLETFLMKTQYGVRKGHSTSHAVFPARRFQNLAEVSGTPISIVLLDWEKAFDRIDHGRLL